MAQKKFPVWILVPIAFALLGAILVSVVYGGHFGWGNPLGNQEQFGQFGDFVGGVLNPFLSFITVVSVLWSLHIQHHALQSSQDGFKTQVEASERQFVRQQLLEAAERYLTRIEMLRSEKVFGSPILDSTLASWYGLNSFFVHNEPVPPEVESPYRGQMEAWMGDTNSRALVLNGIKRNIRFVVTVGCSLIGELREEVLRMHWVIRISDHITEYSDMGILSRIEAASLLVALEHASSESRSKSK